VQDMPMMK